MNKFTVPPLDSEFDPLFLQLKNFERSVQESGKTFPAQIAIVQSPENIFTFSFNLYADETSERVKSNLFWTLFYLKFLSWSRMGHTVKLYIPQTLHDSIRLYYSDKGEGNFDRLFFADKVFIRPFELHFAKTAAEIPANACTKEVIKTSDQATAIGIDLGASRIKTIVLKSGKMIYHHVTDWHPLQYQDAKIHLTKIGESLKQAISFAKVKAPVGISTAGIVTDNQLRVSSLLRNTTNFKSAEWNKELSSLFTQLGLPHYFMINDGEAAALTELTDAHQGVLGLSFGSSLAAGYITPQNEVLSFANELAFVPIDLNSKAPLDDWSGAKGLVAQYLSKLGLHRALRHYQFKHDPLVSEETLDRAIEQMQMRPDTFSKQLYQTLGVYLGYTLPLFKKFYSFDQVLLMGGILQGELGDKLVQSAIEVLQTMEDPELKKLNLKLVASGERAFAQARSVAGIAFNHYQG